MYIKTTITDRMSRLGDVARPIDSLETTGTYRPMSYYVFGGIDIDGDALKETGQASFDTDEEIAAGCGVDAFCDPRVSKFDVAEQAGVEAYEAYKQEQEKAASAAAAGSVEE